MSETAKHSRRAAPVTAAQLAAMNFVAWKHKPDEWEPPDNEEWGADAIRVLPYVRLAWHLLFKSKAEVENGVQELGDDLEELVKSIAHTREYFENFVNILDGAEVRLMCSAASLEKRKTN
jgi:hypothetical protein